jgi:hypothetical protein
MFFFEKKNQKTFAQRAAEVQATPSPKEQKFFASFFQKRRTFLYLIALSWQQ